MKASSIVYLVSTANRKAGVSRCFSLLNPPAYSGKRLFVKPNFNTADPCPGSTHNDTLDAVLSELRALGPASITVGDRSGPAKTADVLLEKGIYELCAKYNAAVVDFDELAEEDWLTVDKPGLHWPGGFQFPKIAAQADHIISTCALKTHGYGGVYSASLKLGVGFVPRDFKKLHSTPDMRKMIAEINLAYTPDFVILDAIEVFTDGGPMEGTRATANLFLASSDRIAIDAVGLAVLKNLGSNRAIMDTPIFKQEQIQRAVELGLGAASPADIRIETDDVESEALAVRLREILQSER